MNTLNPDKKILWAHGSVPISWPAFLKQLVDFCELCGWVVEFESVADGSCAVFFVAHPDQEVEETVAMRDSTGEELPF